MFEMFKPKPKEEAPTMPTFEELVVALPEELREEFQVIREKIRNIADLKGGAMDGSEVDDESLTDEERSIFDRHAELQKMALERLSQGS